VTYQRIVKHPLFLLVEVLIGLWIIESNLPPAIFGWKGIGFLMVVHSAVTILYLTLCDIQRRRSREAKGNGLD